MIQKIREVALIFRERYGRNLATGFLGELYACKVLGLELAENPIQKGYDAAKDGKKYQIKTRCSIKGSKVNLRGRIGKFRDSDFDYALLVLLDDKYNLKEIWQAEAKNEKLKTAIKKDQTKNSGMHIKTFIDIAQKFFPNQRQKNERLMSCLLRDSK